jgi:hypothetical protein
MLAVYLSNVFSLLLFTFFSIGAIPRRPAKQTRSRNMQKSTKFFEKVPMTKFGDDGES